MAFGRWSLGCCCTDEEIPICEGEFALPATLAFTDSILGAGTGTYDPAPPIGLDHGYGAWHGTLTVDIPARDPGDPCGDVELGCPAVDAFEVEYWLVPFLDIDLTCQFELFCVILIDDAELCIVAGPTSEADFAATHAAGPFWTTPPAFSVTLTLGGDYWLSVLHGCAASYDVTWSQ